MVRRFPHEGTVAESIQFIALSFHGLIKRVRCCRCVGLEKAGPLIWGLCILRGTWALCEVGGLLSVVTNRHVAGGILRAMMLFAGIGDIAGGLVGLSGHMLRSLPLTAGFTVWLFAHCFICAIIGLMASTLDTVGLGPSVTFFFAMIFLAFDIYLFFIGLTLLGRAVLLKTVAPSMIRIMEESQDEAMRCGESTISGRHLLSVLLSDEESRYVLQTSGVDIDNMTQLVEAHAMRRAEDTTEHPGSALMRCFSSDAETLMYTAARLQREGNDERLTADHLILAFCIRGEIAITPNGDVAIDENAGYMGAQTYPVDVRIVNHHLSISRKQARALKMRGRSRAAPVFGCLPLEETVAVYLALQVTIDLSSIFCLVFLGRGVGMLGGLKTVGEMRSLELMVSFVSGTIASAGLYSILHHQQARLNIHEAAFKLGAKWDIDLDAAFNAVRDERDALSWLHALKLAALVLGGICIWSLAEILFELPIVGMYLVNSNVCGSYRHGLVAVGSMGNHGISHLHCSMTDYVAMLGVVSWFGLKLGMCWAILALWHQYQYGWTTTDPRGSTYLTSFSLLPEALVRALAGLPKFARARAGNEESKPLLL